MTQGVPSSIPSYLPASHEWDLMDSLYSHCDRNDQSNAQAVLNSHLSERCQNEIYRHVSICYGRPGGDAQFGKHHALKDLNLLGAAVHSYATEVFRSLNENERHFIEGKVWENAGKSQTNDEKWREHHAMESTTRLLRSLKDWRHAANEELGPLKDQKGFIAMTRPLLATGALSIGEVVHLSMVCKTFRAAIDAEYPRDFWINAFRNEGIPMVESAQGEERNHRADYLALAPITLSGRVISEFLGRPVGPIPKISQEAFDRLSHADSFQEGTNRDSCVIVVLPSVIQRTAGKAFPFALDPKGNLVPAPAEAVEGQVLNIPFSLKNLRVLCEYPLKGAENGPVFGRNSYDPIFEQCGLASNTTRVFLMRKQVADQSRNMTYEDQKKLVAEHRFEVPPLLLTALVAAVDILAKGICSHGRNPLTYARTSDQVLVGKNLYPSAIGGFAPGAGVHVDDYYNVSDCFGVVPGAPAEVLSAIGH